MKPTPRKLMRGHCYLGIIRRYNKMNNEQWVLQKTDYLNIMNYKLSGDEYYSEHFDHWKFRFGYVETRKNKIHRW